MSASHGVVSRKATYETALSTPQEPRKIPPARIPPTIWDTINTTPVMV
jgi:hypothetical protein